MTESHYLPTRTLNIAPCPYLRLIMSGCFPLNSYMQDIQEGTVRVRCKRSLLSDCARLNQPG